MNKKKYKCDCGWKGNDVIEKKKKHSALYCPACDVIVAAEWAYWVSIAPKAERVSILLARPRQEKQMKLF